VPTTTLPRNPVVVGSAQDILERLERYAAARHERAATGAPLPPVAAAPPVHPFDAATVDLFPYDLVATVVAAAVTILTSVASALPAALAVAAGLIGFGEWSRRARWFPSVGVNLVIGAVVGAVLVLVS
jgi:hypothetical protein